MLHTPEFARLACELYQAANRYRQALEEEMGPIESVRIEGDVIVSVDRELRQHTIVVSDRLIAVAFPEPPKNADQVGRGYRYRVREDASGKWTVLLCVSGLPTVSVGGSEQREQAGLIAHHHRTKTVYDHPEWCELEPISYHPYGAP